MAYLAPILLVVEELPELTVPRYLPVVPVVLVPLRTLLTAVTAVEVAVRLSSHLLLAAMAVLVVTEAAVEAAVESE